MCRPNFTIVKTILWILTEEGIVCKMVSHQAPIIFLCLLNACRPSLQYKLVCNINLVSKLGILFQLTSTYSISLSRPDICAG